MNTFSIYYIQSNLPVVTSTTGAITINQRPGQCRQFLRSIPPFSGIIADLLSDINCTEIVICDAAIIVKARSCITFCCCCCCSTIHQSTQLPCRLLPLLFAYCSFRPCDILIQCLPGEHPGPGAIAAKNKNNQKMPFTKQRLGPIA